MFVILLTLILQTEPNNYVINILLLLLVVTYTSINLVTFWDKTRD